MMTEKEILDVLEAVTMKIPVQIYKTHTPQWGYWCDRENIAVEEAIFCIKRGDRYRIKPELVCNCCKQKILNPSDAVHEWDNFGYLCENCFRYKHPECDMVDSKPYRP